MPSAKKNFILEQGSDWVREMIFKETKDGPVIDITGYTFAFQVKDPVTKMVIFSLQSGNGIDVDPLAGKITLTIPAAMSAVANVSGVRVQTVVEQLSDNQTYSALGHGCAYNLEVYSGPSTSRLMSGIICVVPEIVS